MSMLLYIISIILMMLAVSIISNSRSAIHEILGALTFVGAFICMSGGAVVHRLGELIRASKRK